MRILWLKAGKLLPVDTGGRIRTYNILRHLARRNDVTFLSCYPGTADAEYAERLRTEFPGAVEVALGGAGGSVARALHYGARLPLAAPYSVTKFTAQPVVRALLRLVEEREPDVVVCDFLAPSLNVPRLAVPTVLFQHNVESALWRRQARYERHPAKRLAFALEANKMDRYERAALARFDRIVAVSGHDRALMLEMAPEASITVVPTGVDVERFRAPSDRRASRPTVMFLGSMDWPANIDGVEYFCGSIWPRVLAAVPDARFQIVGRSPPERIRQLAGPAVEVVGGVESVLPHLHAATVFVVPLRIGGGTRLKIYEAMAAGVPIVSTTVGAEGLDVRDGHDIILADDPASFGDAVAGLLQDAERRTAIASAASATASRFDWSMIAIEFERVLRDAMSTPPAGSRAGVRPGSPASDRR